MSKAKRPPVSMAALQRERDSVTRVLLQERTNAFIVALGGLEAVVAEADKGNEEAQDALGRLNAALARARGLGGR